MRPVVFDAQINLSESGRWFDTGLDASYSTAVSALDDAGVDRAVLIAQPGTCTNSVFENSEIDRRRFWCAGNVDLSRVDSSLKEVEALDLDALMFHPRMQSAGLNLLLETGLGDKLVHLGIPIMICAWQQSLTVSIEEVSPLLVDKLARRYPTTKFLISHMGGHRFWDSIMVARSNENVFLDCSYFLTFFEGTSLVDDFYRILPKIDQKLIYGSDFPEISPKNYLNDFLERTASLSQASLEKICSGNLHRFMSSAAID
jgi:predicted TIM-barrel fold metal-dependent hydrolase